MRGTVIGFDPELNSGAISAEDGRRYDFVTLDLRGSGRVLRHGDKVEFSPADENRAADVARVEPEYVPPGLLRFYFSPVARISRSQYWLRGVLPLWGIFLILLVLSSTLGDGSAAKNVSAITLVYGLAMIWPAFVIQIKRIHDREKTGWLVLLPLIPCALLAITWVVALGQVTFTASYWVEKDMRVLVGAAAVSWLFILALIGIAIWFFVEFGCLRGTVGANRYGPDPVRPD